MSVLGCNDLVVYDQTIQVTVMGDDPAGASAAAIAKAFEQAMDILEAFDCGEKCPAQEVVISVSKPQTSVEGTKGKDDYRTVGSCQMDLTIECVK